MCKNEIFIGATAISCCHQVRFFQTVALHSAFPGNNLIFMIEIIAVSNIYINLPKFLRYGWMLGARFSTPLGCVLEFSYL